MKLKEICTYVNEKINVNDMVVDNYISTENLLPNFNGFKKAMSIPIKGKVTQYAKDNILISNIRPYFKKMIFANSNGSCSSDVLVLKVDPDKVIPKFLYYILMNDSFFNYVTASAKGTKMPRGDKSAIMEYDIYIPDKLIQKKVVKIFSDIDNKIELNNQINDNLIYQVA